LVLRCLGAVAAGAQSASVAWVVVGVGALLDELASTEWPVVGDGGRRGPAQDAHDTQHETRFRPAVLTRDTV